jgi:hypothetical protein
VRHCFGAGVPDDGCHPWAAAWQRALEIRGMRQGGGPGSTTRWRSAAWRDEAVRGDGDGAQQRRYHLEAGWRQGEDKVGSLVRSCVV